MVAAELLSRKSVDIDCISLTAVDDASGVAASSLPLATTLLESKMADKKKEQRRTAEVATDAAASARRFIIFYILFAILLFINIQKSSACGHIIYSSIMSDITPAYSLET
jgi:hypothetical protein